MSDLAHRTETARTRIERTLRRSKRPAIMCSFGKDSLVLCDLLADYIDVPDTLYLENIDEIVDAEYNAMIVERYGLRMHLLPRGRGVLFFVRDTAQFFCFPFLSSQTMLPVPMSLTPWTGKGDYLCVDEELRATHGTVVSYNFDALFFGHKRCDLLDGGGSCLPWFPLLSDASKRAYHARMTPQSPYWKINEMAACSPLYDWSQADVWAYIEAHGLPISEKVYDPIARTRRLHTNQACFRCHDPSLPAKVHCPKLGQPITNLGALMPRGAQDLVPLGMLEPREVEELHA